MLSFEIQFKSKLFNLLVRSRWVLNPWETTFIPIMLKYQSVKKYCQNVAWNVANFRNNLIIQISSNCGLYKFIYILKPLSCIFFLKMATKIFFTKFKLKVMHTFRNNNFGIKFGTPVLKEYVWITKDCGRQFFCQKCFNGN